MSASPSTGLNLAQQQAVNHLHGPCLVLAGAGSGKTRVITHKIARLIQVGVAADRILAITFTNKAAAEMRERARSLIGRAAAGVVICTFHALGVRLLREDGTALGLKPQFSILDADDVTSLLKDVGGSGVDAATARRWQWAISSWKNQGLNAQAAAEQARDAEQAHLARLFERYQERLSAYQSVDFDDLIGLPLRLLHDHPEVAAKWRARWAHVLIDEVQDTNTTQYALLRALLATDPAQARFTAVGDDDQSIYGWRGATLDNLRQLPLDYPALQVIKLEQNYRSTSAILRAANAVIAPNPKLFEKRLWSDLGEGEAVRVLAADDEAAEAERTVERIRHLRAAHPGTEWRAFAVLYRANHQAKPFEKALRRAQMPYKVSGGTSFFDRAEIKDLCAWFRLWINPADDPAFLRAVSTPRRGIGHQTLASLGELAGRFRLSLFDALSSGSLGAVVGGKALSALHSFGNEVLAARERAQTTLGAPAARQFLTEWLDALGYERHLIDAEDSPERARARWSNVQDFCDWMAQRCAGEADPSGAQTSPEGQPLSLLRVAQTVSLLSTLTEQDRDPNVITLSTLHAAKGLEWPHVVLAGVCEGLLPFQPRSSATQAPDADADDAAGVVRLEEERRLMYVGVTRAQRSLCVSWPSRRKAGRETTPCQPSRFIADMALENTQPKTDPRAKLRALREEFAQRAGQTQAGPA